MKKMFVLALLGIMFAIPNVSYASSNGTVYVQTQVYNQIHKKGKNKLQKKSSPRYYHIALVNTLHPWFK